MMKKQMVHSKPKIAIAVSGVGHIYRGMEGWAESMAVALTDMGIDLSLFRGAGPKTHSYDNVLPCIHRTSKIAKILVKVFKKGGWRLGLGSAGQIEAWSYGLFLLFHLRKGYDIVHIKQGNLAVFLHHAKRFGLIKTPFILSNGQIANSKFINRFNFIQFLSPQEKEEMTGVLGAKKGWFVVPNFVDTALFKPLPQKQCREKLGIPNDRFVILSVGAIKRYHKRMDHFSREMGAVKKQFGDSVQVVIAGSIDPETNQVVAEGRRLLGDQLSIITNIPKSEMPYVYNVADVFALCSLKEAFGNVYIEAMACGIPVIHHNYPVTEWITGKGGISINLSHNGKLEKTVSDLINYPERLKKIGEAGRKRVQRMFSKEVVLKDTLSMYQAVLISAGP